MQCPGSSGSKTRHVGVGDGLGVADVVGVTDGAGFDELLAVPEADSAPLLVLDEPVAG